MLGIVEIPDVFFLDDEKGEYVPRAALTIYTRPDSDSQVLTVITSPQAIDEAAFSSERAGALVYGREHGFFLIRTSRGVGWLSPHNAGSFHSLETLLDERELTYLTAAWDGFMSASPGGANRTRVTSRSPDGNEARDVRVKRLRRVKAKLWVELEVISHTFCESNEPPRSRPVAGSGRTTLLARRQCGSTPAAVSPQRPATSYSSLPSPLRFAVGGPASRQGVCRVVTITVCDRLEPERATPAGGRLLYYPGQRRQSDNDRRYSPVLGESRSGRVPDEQFWGCSRRDFSHSSSLVD